MSGISLKYSIDMHRAEMQMQNLEHFDSRAMFDDVGAYLDSEVANRFRAGIDADGNDLIPSQRAIREGGKTLVDHGHLRDSYTHQVFIDGSGVEQGSDDIRAAIHHFGGETGRGHATTLPARPVIGVNPDDEGEISSIAQDHLRRALQ